MTAPDEPHTTPRRDRVIRFLLVVYIVGALFRSADAAEPDPPASNGPVKTRRRPLRAAAYVGLPLLAALVSLAIVVHLLDIATLPADPQHDVGMAFSVDGFETLQLYAVDMFLDSFRKALGPLPEFESSAATNITVVANGCSNPVSVYGTVDLDPRWLLAIKQTRSHRVLDLPLTYGRHGQQYVSTTPHVEGQFAFGIGGLISDFRAKMEGFGIPIPVQLRDVYGTNSPNITIVTGTVPASEFDSRIQITPYNGDAIEFSFHAPWELPRGFESCYVRLPRLIDDPYVSTLPVQRPDVGTARPPGPATGRTELIAQNLTVDLQDTTPPPNSAGGIPTWSCARGNGSSGSLAIPPDCYATAVLTTPNESAHLQLWVIILAAIFSGGIVGAAAGLRRLLLGPE